MRMTLIFHIHNTVVPRAVVRGPLYTVVSRSSMVGFHKKTTSQSILDPLCTKTVLLTFTDEADAKEVVNVLENIQGKIHRFQRDIEFYHNDVAMIDNYPEQTPESGEVAYGDSIKPLHVENIPYNHMERLCLLHHFDMLIVYKKMIDKISESWYEIGFDCYEYKTNEAPNRDIQEKIFRDMFYYHPDEE